MPHYSGNSNPSSGSTFPSPGAAETLYQPESGNVPATPSASPGSQSSPAMNEMERLRQYIAMLSPEDREVFFDSMFADYAGEEGELDQQRSMAEELRGTPGAEARQYGGIYMAANPLEHAASSLNQFRGVREGKAAETVASGLTDQRAMAQRQMAEALTGMR